MRKIPKQSDRPDQKATMELLREQKIARRLQEIPRKYRGIYKKAVQTNSKAAAIKAFCLECVCWQKNEIINCSCLTCPLYGVRPFLKSRKPGKNGKFARQTAANLSPTIAKQGSTKITACFAH